MEPGPIPEVEVIEPPRPGRRRRYSAEDKRRIVEETRVPGQSVSSVSRRYGVSPSQVFKWRRLVEEGTMSVLVLPAQFLTPISRFDLTSTCGRRVCEGLSASSTST